MARTVDNMIMLEDVSERGILTNLKNMYKKDNIYTFIGEVLISVNPFKHLNIYNEQKLRQYRSHYPFELPPHVYSIAESAYRNLISERVSQSIIISGESGAGKTEAAKQIMNYIAAVSGGEKEGENRVKAQILKSNPLLEAFGNAKTVRNNNSSRFGKYMEIFFSDLNQIMGGQIMQFLLEKSRIVSQSQGERNFHIFYQIFTDDALAKKLNLTKPQDYKYLNNTYTVDTVDDKQGFRETKEALDFIGVKEETQFQIWEMVAGILHLGNIEFQGVEKNAKGGRKDGSEIIDKNPLRLCAKCLHVDEQMLETSLTTKTVEAGGRNSVYASPLSVDGAINARDALAKGLYRRLFDWIVKSVNESITLPSLINRRLSTMNGKPGKKGEKLNTKPNEFVTIGILDIYGFEIFETNSLEQLTINYINERLQQMFIELTLKEEQEEYIREGIKWEKIPYSDNKPCVELFDSKLGIFNLLNETSLLSKGDDDFLRKLKENNGKHPFMVPFDKVISKEQEKNFKVKHYAGIVEYHSPTFVEKNLDTLYQNLVALALSSRSDLMVQLFSSDKIATGGNNVAAKPPMICTQFKKQVDHLMTKLYNCKPHYIRCIKPNDRKIGNLFEDEMVTHQIRCLGLLENVLVKRAGFVYRHKFDFFLHHYKVTTKETYPFLADSFRGNEIEACKHIAQNVLKSGADHSKMFQIGKTKIFIKNPETVFALEELRDRCSIDCAIQIQRKFRKFIAKKRAEENKREINNIFNNQKKRRRISYNRIYQGDYLNFAFNSEMAKLLAKHNDSMIHYSGRIQKINNRNKIQDRTLVITESNIYNIDWNDKKNKMKLKRILPLSDLISLKVSPFTDGYFVLFFGTRYCYFFNSDDTSEIVSILIRIFKQKQKKIPVEVAQQFDYKPTLKETRTLKFIEVSAIPKNGPIDKTGKSEITVSIIPAAEEKYYK
ncbi:myosin [Naegleria gruberi]|uniref:Myosin n=1 Tax=Naegleria gruberi TaxID=5762 RepID=D2VG39_NAEGR|nr:myosin [Naegleria gruberi]EFC44202.1 myosin [Naegleria gruberi]|eukprot:XP_002676946.1 myosin [Naegleria gruberi]